MMEELEHLDPTLRHDPLPMPYRLIDKLVTSILNPLFFLVSSSLFFFFLLFFLLFFYI